MGGLFGNLQKEKQKEVFGITVNRQAEEQKTVFPQQQMQERQKAADSKSETSTRSSIFDKARKEDVYVLQESEVRDNFSDKRVDAFQEILRVNSELDSKLFEKREKESDAVGLYRKMMDAISKYAALSPITTPLKEQAEALREARNAIAVYQKLRKEQGNGDDMKKGDEVAERYSLYFATFADGSLIEQKGKYQLKIDGTTKENTPAINKRDIFATYSDRRGDALFPHEPSMNDIRQGQLGDCYLEAAISSLVMNHPEKLKEGMKDNGDGTVTVRFFKSRDKLEEKEREEMISNEVKELWENENYKNMGDDNLMFKLLQYGGDGAACKQYTDRYINVFVPEKMVEEKWKPEEKPAQIACMYASRYELEKILEASNKLSRGEKILELAKYFSQNENVKIQVINKMRNALSQPDAQPDLIFQQALMDLTQFIPNDHGQNPLVREKWQNALDLESFKEKQKEFFKDDCPEMVPVYVTVTKEVPTSWGNDLYTRECLWMQLLQKAYAASGLHDSKVSKLKEKQKKEQDALRAKLKKQGASDVKIEEEVHKLVQEQAVELEQMKHSFKNIEGGRSSEFLETFTMEKAEKKELDSPKEALEKIFGVKTKIKEMIGNAFPDFPKLKRIPTTYILDIIQKKLTDDFSVEYKNKKGDGKEERYYRGPIYFEDIEKVFESQEFNQAFNYAFDIVFKRVQDESKIPDKERIKDIIRDIIKIQICEKMKESLQYRPMSGNYTDFAVEQYEKIKLALDHGMPVNIGVRKFLPKGVKATGKNGESEQNGLVEGHAYSVVGVMEKDGNRVVRLRNPWGHGVLRYTKVTRTNGTDLYTSKKVDTAVTEGIFEMELNDLLSRISAIHLNGKLPNPPQNPPAA